MANGRPLGRVLGDQVAYFVLGRLSVRELQAVSGSSLAGYTKWAKQKKINSGVDNLESDTRLMWVGPKDADHVIIYCHGGGFVGPLSDFQVEFWYRIQQALSNSQGIKLGVAILQYSTYSVTFSTQVNQLLASIQHVTSLGVPPSKICFSGDSGGANIVTQLLGHILRPSSLVAQSPSPESMARFAGICLISPWTFPSSVRKTDDSFDLVPAKCLGLWMDTYLSTTPDSYIRPAG
ncbi:hypothetical protein C8R45DRAFT_1108730 [Mycena sanguinolenta]|nr:hypothetical protein C8R45DRAFT_1108730 [Mycena sanguinolenta]